MKNIALFLAVLALCCTAHAGTMIIEGLPERVNTWAGPVTLYFDIVSNGQLDNDSIYVWTYKPADVGISGATNQINPFEICIEFPCPLERLPADWLLPYIPGIDNISSYVVWADIAIIKPIPAVIAGDIITDLELTIPQGFEGTLQVKVLSEFSARVEGAATIDVYTECIPNTHEYAMQYAQWTDLGKPDCWCNDYGKLGATGNQCYGDAAGDRHSKGYVIYATDISALAGSWKAKIGDPHLDPCADFAHLSHARGYVVYADDLAILATNWKRTSLPGDCPKTDAEMGL